MGTPYLIRRAGRQLLAPNQVGCPHLRLGGDVLGVARIAVVLVRVVRVPAFPRAEVELEALAVAGGDHAFEIMRAVLDRLLADAAFLPDCVGHRYRDPRLSGCELENAGSFMHSS